VVSARPEFRNPGMTLAADASAADCRNFLRDIVREGDIVAPNFEACPQLVEGRGFTAGSPLL